MTNLTDHKEGPVLSKWSFFDNINEEKVAGWLTAYGKNISYLIAGFLVFLACVYFIGGSFQARPEKEYLQAAYDFNTFLRVNPTENSVLSEEAYLRLKEIMSKHPELHAAYDAPLAQTFLNRGEPIEARPYADAALLRTHSDHLEYYADYASTTLLIAEQQFQEALNSAKALQTKMTDVLTAESNRKTRSFGDVLFAFNLLRIAILQQELGDKAGELESWRQWKQYAGLGKETSTAKVDAAAFRLVIQQLAVGAVSLPDYISYREKVLLIP